MGCSALTRRKYRASHPNHRRGVQRKSTRDLVTDGIQGGDRASGVSPETSINRCRLPRAGLHQYRASNIQQIRLVGGFWRLSV